MKYTLIAIGAILSQMALADVPTPPAPEDGEENSTVVAVVESQEAARAIYNAIPGEEKMGSTLRTSTEKFKVLDSEDELSRVVCTRTRTTKNKKSTYRCTTTRSLDGDELPEYRHPIRMG